MQLGHCSGGLLSSSAESSAARCRGRVSLRESRSLSVQFQYCYTTSGVCFCVSEPLGRSNRCLRLCQRADKASRAWLLWCMTVLWNLQRIICVIRVRNLSFYWKISSLWSSRMRCKTFYKWVLEHEDMRKKISDMCINTIGKYFLSYGCGRHKFGLITLFFFKNSPNQLWALKLATYKWFLD